MNAVAKDPKREYLILGIILYVVADMIMICERYLPEFPFFLGIYILLFLAVIPVSVYCLIKWGFGSFRQSVWVTVCLFANAFLCYSMFDGPRPWLVKEWAHRSFRFWVIGGICSAVVTFLVIWPKGQREIR